MSAPLLAAALIVRNESAHLAACLEALQALRPVLAEIVVYDTGSTDDTCEIAERFGVRVERGYWDGDFARARNAATDLARARWVLTVDADERVVADVGRLREALRRERHRGIDLDALALPVVNIAPDGSEMYAGPSIRLFRRGRARWDGRVHERVVATGPSGRKLCLIELPREVVHVRHLGYRDPDVVRAKAERNLAIADAELRRVETQSGEVADLVTVLYHRGRTLLSLGRHADARLDLERLSALRVETVEQSWGRDVLAQLLLDTGDVEGVHALVDLLAAAGVSPGWCAWLRARAFVSRERYRDASALLRSVDELVDAVGRRHDLALVVETQLVVAARVGEVDEAVACCIRLMAGFGRVEGLGPLLLTLWGDRPAAWLADVLAGVGPAHLQAVAAELRGCAAPGPEVAEALEACIVAVR